MDAIPNEILLEIFQQLQAETSFIIGRENPAAKKTSDTTVLSQVKYCLIPSYVASSRIRQVNRKWRELTFSTSSLWSNITILFDAQGRATPKIPTIKRHLENSGENHLSICICSRELSGTRRYNHFIPEGAHSMPINTFYDVFDILKNHFSRWEKFHIEADCSRTGQIARFLTTNTSKKLSSVYYSDIIQGDAFAQWFVPQLLASKSFQHLSLDGCSSDLVPALIAPSSLTTLDLVSRRQHIYADAVIEILKHCGDTLQHFSFAGVHMNNLEEFMEFSQENPHIICNIPSLQMLDGIGRCAHLFLSMLELPSLTRFGSNRIDMADLKSLLTRSGTRLVDLSLRLGEEFIDDLVMLFEVTPALVTLNLDIRPGFRVGTRSDVITVLTVLEEDISASNVLLPLLQTIHFGPWLTQRATSDDGALGYMVVSRLTLIEKPTLKCISLELYDESKYPVDCSQLREMMEKRGLKVYWDGGFFDLPFYRSYDSELFKPRYY
ncbi:hypothetical protein C8J56DRAFT_1061646 [Mycena floridula]|nr:hypothetical protein C8J56DRAFT_1061646 [Mycena floridula]